MDVPLTVEYSKTALKALRRIDQATAEKLMEKIDAYAADPVASRPWARAMAGTNGLRIRQGDYRAVCVIRNGAASVLAVLKIGHRKEIYR
jgi:mRNA interferase RelE/StbE